MKKIIILISLFTCIFISGCNMQKMKKIESLEDAYFYLFDKTENEEDIGIDYVKKLLKDYKLEISDLSKVHDVEGEKCYEYIFTGDNETYLSVGFIVSKNKEIIDSLTYNKGSDEIILFSDKVSTGWHHYIEYSYLDKSIYKKIIREIDKLGLSLQRKEGQYPLEDACYYIADEIDNGKNIKIEDIKKLLKDYSFELELIEDDPTIDLKTYYYTFRNNDAESVKITVDVVNNKESISMIMHSIDKFSNNSNLILFFDNESEVSISYETNDKVTYKKAWDLINEMK